MKTRLFSLMSLVVAVSVILLLTSAPLAQAGREIPVLVNPSHPIDVGALLTYTLYIPLVFGPGPACGTGQSYSQGPVYQYDNDNPVRPAYNHADKNFGMRGYTADNGQPKTLTTVGGDGSDANAPQLGTLVSPARKFVFTSTRSTYNWNWGSGPPDPGTKGSVMSSPAVTVAGLQVTQGETIRVPTSGYDLGAGVRAIVLYAASTRITVHYTREDSVATGYSIHIDNICVDPNLLSLYNSLDGTARNTYYGTPCCGTDYNLVTLTANQPIGTASTTELIVVIRDTGGFMNPRHCQDWWRAWWNGSSCT
jgi:hypothetical protein